MVARAIQQAVPRILEHKYAESDPARAEKYRKMGEDMDFRPYNDEVKLTSQEIDSILPKIMNVFSKLKPKQ